MLQFRLAAALEVLDASVGREPVETALGLPTLFDVAQAQKSTLIHCRWSRTPPTLTGVLFCTSLLHSLRPRGRARGLAH